MSADVESSQPNTGQTLLVGVIGTIVFTVTVLLLQALYYNQRTTEMAAVAKQPYEELQAYRAEQESRLRGAGGPSTIDRAIGEVARQGGWVPARPAGTSAAPASPGVAAPPAMK